MVDLPALAVPERSEEGLDPPRARVLELLDRHGWNATAFQTLAPGYEYFFVGPDACVAYVDTGWAWVAAGAPIAATTALAEVAAAFVRAARGAGRRCCFFATEERLRSAAAGLLDSLALGEQPSWDPRGWPAILSQTRSLREQLRRATAKGVQVRLVETAELVQGPTHEALVRLTTRWLATREMAPMDFLVRVTPFLVPSRRRCFVAELDGRIVGCAMVLPVPARGGWFLENLLRDPAAPNGTGERLIDAVMRWAAGAGGTWLTLGLAPLAGDLAGPLRLARRHTAALYDFEGLQRYKAKLRPHLWSPVFLSYPSGQGVLWSLLDVLVAFSGGGLVYFGLRTLVRGPRVVLRVLAVALAGCALLSLGRMVGDEPRQAGWHAVEGWLLVVVAVGLWRLARRPVGSQFTWLVLLTSLDVVVCVANRLLDSGNTAHTPAWSTGLTLVSVVCLLLAVVVVRGAHARFRQTS